MEDFSLVEPWDWFRATYPETVPNTLPAMQFFCLKINTPERLEALRVNLPKWCETRKFLGGFAGSWQRWLASEVWLTPPKPAELGREAHVDRGARNYVIEQTPEVKAIYAWAEQHGFKIHDGNDLLAAADAMEKG